MSNEGKEVIIPQPKIKQVTIKIEGVTPLLMEKMDPRVAEVYDKKKSKKLYEEDTRSEREKVDDKIHYTADGNIGYPTAGFLRGMLNVAPRINGKSKPPHKTEINQGVSFLDNITPIEYKKQDVAEHIGFTKGSNSSPRLILRPQFNGWSTTLRISYNEDIFSLEQLINLINWAGFHCGIGGFRKNCSGSFGQYRVATNGN